MPAKRDDVDRVAREILGGPAPAPAAAPAAPPFAEPKPISELKAAEIGGDWFWHGYLARHTTTLLSSLWKAGKTTLLSHLLKVLETGGVFCGHTVRPTRVLYVTEEAEWVWAKRRDKIGIGDHVFMQCRPFRARARMPEWLGLLSHLRDYVEKWDIGLVAFDPLTTLWPVEKENEAGAVTDALLPLNMLTDRAGVLLSHHFRKSDGQEATGARGSGALPGYVDTILELRRYDASKRGDHRRVISGWGRFEETPEELVVELTDGGYVAHGDKGEVKKKSATAVLRTVLPTHEPGWTWQAVKPALDEALGDDGPGPGNTRLLALLNDGYEAGLWNRTGEGNKGDPYRFWRDG